MTKSSWTEGKDPISSLSNNLLFSSIQKRVRCRETHFFQLLPRRSVLSSIFHYIKYFPDPCLQNSVIFQKGANGLTNFNVKELVVVDCQVSKKKNCRLPSSTPSEPVRRTSSQFCEGVSILKLKTYYTFQTTIN